MTGADRAVTALFAVLHDARRLNDGRDPEHGRRGAELARELGRERLGLRSAQMELLVAACELHADGGTRGDVTLLTCWDADRLDLWRVFIEPDDELLCTDAARDPDVKRWARERSLMGHSPSFVADEWGVPTGDPREYADAV
jgi:uncharacterized protein